MGNCYRFNSGRNQLGENIPIKMSNMEGSDNGLKLELYVGKEQMNQLVMSTGLFISIHNRSMKPILPEQGFNIQTNRINDIEISKTVYEKLKTPKSFCLKDTQNKNAFDSQLYKSTFDFSSQYNQESCFKLCFQKEIIEKCGCYDLSYPSMNLSNVPCRLEKIYCIKEQMSKTLDEEFLSTYCEPNCPLECDKVDYSYTISGSSYPTDVYTDILFRNAPQNFSGIFGNDSYSNGLKKSVLQLNIYFKSLSYTQISESEQLTLLSFFSRTGGLLGLFIGSSVLSILEIFEYIFIAINKFYYLKKRQNYKFSDSSTIPKI